jgi:hypothetical protein
MAMSKRTRIVLIVIGVAVLAYLAYRWYSNRQATQPAAGTGLGSNLNSLAPELVAGSAGPSSGLTYTPGNSTVDLVLPGGGPSQDITGSDTESSTDTDADEDDIVVPPPIHDCPRGMHKDPKTGKCVPIPKPKPKPKPKPRRHFPPPRPGSRPPHRVPPPVGPVRP